MDCEALGPNGEQCDKEEGHSLASLEATRKHSGIRPEHRVEWWADYRNPAVRSK